MIEAVQAWALDHKGLWALFVILPAFLGAMILAHGYYERKGK